MSTPRRTPLFERHQSLGAKIVDFAGFEMPVRYSSEKEEHKVVREAVGVFDVSHMGEVFIEGDDAMKAVQRLFSNDASKIVDGQAMYTGMLTDEGTFVDDAIVYRFHDKRFLVCTNAGNREKDTAWIKKIVERDVSGVTVRDEGDAWAQIAIQGPKAIEVVAAMCPKGSAGDDVRDIKGYCFAEGTIGTDGGQTTGIIARTGYTGEDGFELYVPAKDAVATWDRVFKEGEAHGIKPCGLACRDTLRLEAGMALYGNDIDDQHTPLEAGMGWTVKLDRDDGAADFVGAPALREQKAAGVTRRLRGLEMIDRGIPRHGYPIKTADGEALGEVTSGTQAPFLNKAIAMGYVAADHAAFDHEVCVEVRGRLLKAKIVKLPFYKRPR
jgi:aminomethyltransferase